MLIPRQQPSSNGNNISKISVKKFNDSGLEVKPIFKKMPQHNHVNKLLNTAAAGNGVIGDVDALLTPIPDARLAHQQNNGGSSSKERTERNLWRNDEVMEMLYVMQQIKALEKLNDKTVKSENVFKDVEMIMHKSGFLKKSHVQIWTKWKFLKSTYMTSRRNGIIPRMIPQDIYDVLHQMITSHNQGMSECGNSTTGSVEGDNSNAGTITISGVEGGVTNTVPPNPEEDDSFGMAHPIFGFRLGIVKNEPADSGYDAIENNEPVQEKLPSPEKQSKPEIQNTAKETTAKKNPEIPHRGRGRPPKNPPAATSTPTPAARPNAQMPPLRVAPFAKATNASNALAANRPPPPLTMPPTTRPVRITNLSNLSETIKSSGSVKFSQPKLLPKPSPTQAQIAQAIRLPKEISVHPSRASSTPSPSYPKLKQVPMRKTPYSLRPDRVIPDLEESFSPPPADKSRRFEEVPSTSHLVMQSNVANTSPNGINRKRRMDWQQTNGVGGGPTKLKKIPSDDEETLAAAQDHHNRTQEDNHGKLLQSVVVDLSTTLRKVQTQMMKDFFNKQHELLQKEHEFQMQQDRLIMETFQMQTYEIMKSVKDLVGTIAIGRREEERKSNAIKETKSRRNRKQKRRYVNEETQEVQQHHTEADETEDIEQDEEMGQQQIVQEREEIYSDEDELHEVQEQNGHHNETADEEDNGDAEEGESQSDAGDQHSQEDELNLQQQEPQEQQQLQQQQQHEQPHDEQSQSLDDEEDDDDEDEEEDDDDEEEDEEEDDSDSDDDEDENTAMVNGNDHDHDNDHDSLHMVSNELMDGDEDD